ncbi:hypothetical protein ABTN35_20955, partial [Acinetobacter baumannii]
MLAQVLFLLSITQSKVTEVILVTTRTSIDDGPIRKAVDKAFLSGQADLSEALGPDFDVVRKDSTVVVIDMKSDP